MKSNFTNITGAILVAAVILFSSCKSHERCPAYGKVNTTQEIPS